MSNFKFFLSIIAALIIISCTDNSELVSPDKPAVVVNKIIDSATVQINYGQEASIENNIKIKFDSVNESRCPMDVTCVWAGDGGVGLILSNGNDQQHTFLHTALFPREINYDGYRIILKSLNPYPVSTQQIKKEDYNIDLIVKR